MDEDPSKLRSKPKDEPKTELNVMLRLTLSLMMKPGLKSRGTTLRNMKNISVIIIQY